MPRKKVTSDEREEKRTKKRQKTASRSAKVQQAIDVQVIEKLRRDNRILSGSDESLQVEWISTGIPDLDDVLGGGLPRKRISIFFGEYSSAKTFLVQMIIKQAITQGLQAAYIDTERAYDPTWWAKVGIPLDKLMVSQPENGEAAIDVMLALARANVDVIAIDGLAALIPMEELDENAKAENRTFAAQSRLINRLMRVLTGVQTTSCLVATNQVRDSIGPIPGVKMPGGHAPKFFSSLIIRTRREGWIKEKEKSVGFNLRVQVKKNRVGESEKECSLPFYFRGEIDMIALLMDRALEAGIIEQKGPWFSLTFDDLELPVQQGRNKMIELLKDDAGLRSRVEQTLGGIDE